MKQTLKKRLCLVLVCIVLAGVVAVVFAACNDGGQGGGDGDTAAEVTVTLTVGDADGVTLTTDARYLYDALEDYCAESGIVLEGEEGVYGFYITRIGDLVNGQGGYIMIYHDMDDLTLYTPGYDTERGGKTYHSSSVGVSSLPLRDGASYLIILANA